jgi:hypothetical protein
MAELSESELLGILEGEVDDAVGYYDSDIAHEQEEALKYYFGRPFGDEIPGRSQVVSRDVAETVDWLMPDLMRIFIQGDDAVQYEPITQADEQYAKQATLYANYVFYADNPGQQILHDFAFDGLVQKLGVVRIDWEDPVFGERETYTGLSVMQVQALSQAPNVEIIEGDQEPAADMQSYPDGFSYSVTIRKKPQTGRIKVSAIPPEEFLISRQSTDTESARYVSHRSRKTLSELVEMYPDKKEEIEGLASEDADDTLDTREYERFKDEAYQTRYGPNQRNSATREVIFLDEYVRVDYDGDGIAELRNVRRVDSVIFENEEVSYNVFAAWCPIRVAHKLYGLSLADQTMDIQRIKSVLYRAALDSTYLSVSPRTFVNDSLVNLDDLLNRQVGGVIRTKGNPNEVAMPETIVNQSSEALAMLEYTDQEREGRTGVTRNSQGLDPDSLNKTATGIQLMQNAASARKELIARQLAMGVETLFRKILKTLVAHQDAPRSVKLGQDWIEVDPRSWNADMRVVVHVGLGSGSREAQLSYLNVIKQTQEQILLTLGQTNPICSLSEYFNTLSRMVEAAGFRSPEAFFTDPSQPENAQKQPQPQPDPKMIEVQQKGQIAQAQMQLDAQKQQTDAALKMQQMQAEMQMKAQAMQADFLMKQWQMAAEYGLKERQMQIEAQLSVYGIEVDAKVKAIGSIANAGAKAQAAKINSDVKFGGAVG